MIQKLRRRFRREGLFWRQFIGWAVRNVTPLTEPFLLWLWCGFFFIGFASGRRAIIRNLEVIFPGTSWFWRFRRAFRTFWNFSSTLTDTTRFHETSMALDWEVAGAANLDPLSAGESGIVITAHMGNYDLGAFMFARDTGRTLSVVRAAESDAETELHLKEQRERAGRELGSVEFRNSGDNPALDLFAALRSGKVVAIQGDRAVPHVACIEAEMFGRKISLPAGPFALAMATGARLWPLIISRRGPRYYRAIAFPPIRVQRTGRDRDADIMRGAREWISVLEPVIREHSDQWFAFYEAFGGPAESEPVPPVDLPEKEDASASPAWLAPQRFLFALSRLVAKWRGGQARDAEMRGHRVLAMKPGQNTTERRFVATAAFVYSALVSFAVALSWGVVPAVLISAAMPFIFWMLVAALTSAALFAFGRGLAPAAERVQQRVALCVITALAIFLLTRGLAFAIFATPWIALVVLNTLARVAELVSRSRSA